MPFKSRLLVFDLPGLAVKAEHMIPFSILKLIQFAYVAFEGE